MTHTDKPRQHDPSLGEMETHDAMELPVRHATSILPPGLRMPSPFPGPLPPLEPLDLSIPPTDPDLASPTTPPLPDVPGDEPA
jgi:hypothetical protein